MGRNLKEGEGEIEGHKGNEDWGKKGRRKSSISSTDGERHKGKKKGRRKSSIGGKRHLVDGRKYFTVHEIITNGW